MTRDPVAVDGNDPDLRSTSEGTGDTVPEAGALGRGIEWIGYVFAAAIVASAAALLFEIFMRYVLDSPTNWVHETSIFLCAIAFIYGGLFCAARDSHIRVVLIYDALGPRVRAVLDVIIYVISAISAAFFAWASWLMVETSFWNPSGAFHMEGTGSAWNPPTPALLKGFLLIVMIVLAIQFIVLAVNHARQRGSRQDA
ncbi:TRAP transporter small permease subunit [Aurantimonas aggregata]|uniref:TRAP transporter small permease protein n=1 Tax=Aurantimonas aggregata TaxID=2047720 RepID=A0A6L9MNH2_9HYPH|nr:TRAP transporter small permease [Aurantimonas aggregata]NDV89272.1 TRAP transporter small permease subunit [Aurantimonas aggregata]